MALDRRSLLVGLSGAGLALRAGDARASAPSIELVVVINPALPRIALGASELEAIYTGARRDWPGAKSIIPFNYTPEHPLRVLFDRAVLGMSPQQVGRFWVDQAVRGGPRPPRQIAEPHLGLRLVARMPGAIAYVPASFVDTSVVSVARIRDGKVHAP